MLLAGDIGGTKTRLGLFTAGAARPAAVDVRSYTTGDHASFRKLLDRFSRDLGTRPEVDAAAFGVAGPVVGSRARLTNVAWDVDAADVTAAFGTRRVQLVNDLEALAEAVHVLTEEEITALQHGDPKPDGNAAVIAAGTGLGQACLHRVDGRLVPMPSEGGHADYAARTDREIELLKLVRAAHGRAAVEHVLSGPGLVTLHRFTHRGGRCLIIEDTASPDAPALVSQAGLGGRCQGCAEALQMFAAIYGAEAGNLALRSLALAGVYLGGGIAPKILPALRQGAFLDAFRAKAPMDGLLARIPVRVILNPDAALVGASVRAMALARAAG